MFKKTSEQQINRAKKSVKFRDSIRNTKLPFDDDNEDETGDEEGPTGGLDMEEQEGDESAPNKRAINYQIEKNKGLTPKRNKMYRNPRVRNRVKARKATIKRKSIVPNVRPQEKRYGGEMTGIRTNIVRAVKIK